ncbi:MAG: hypothetical protein JSW33_00800 [bacterium]|nr:MAG: hypothetical protein JSW33_00800 [bacterium]
MFKTRYTKIIRSRGMLAHRPENPARKKQNIIASQLLMSIILVIALTIFGCEKQTLSSLTEQNSGDGLLLSEEQSMQGGPIVYNDVIVETIQLQKKPKNIIFNSSQPDLSTAPVVLLNASIQGDIITLTFSYNGGCMPHEIDLMCKIVEKSNPVQISAQIIHYKSDDPCDEWVTETRAFDLSLLRERYAQVNDHPCSPVILNITDASESNSTVYSIIYDYCSINPVYPPVPPLPPTINPLGNIILE